MKQFKIVYETPDKQKEFVIIGFAAYTSFLKDYGEKQPTDMIFIPRVNKNIQRMAIKSYEPFFDKKENFQSQQYSKTTFDTTVWTPEKKTEWRKILSGMITFYGGSIKCLAANTIIKMAKSAFNLPADSEKRKEFLELGEDDFNYRAWMEYTKKGEGFTKAF